MNHVPFLLLAVFLTCDASAQVKRSSRNLTPLTQKNDAQEAVTRSGNSSLGVPSAPQPTAPEPDTVTRVTFVGPKSGWGFLQTACPHYSPEGRNLGLLPGGTLFTYDGVKTTSKNAVLISRVKRGDAWEGPFLLDCTAVAAYEGSPDSVSPTTLQNLSDYFSIRGKIDARKEALSDAAATANPHYDSAKQAQQAYRETLEKATEMERQMNTLTGIRKSKALDALRAFKYEQVRIKAKADTEALAYKEWKDAHPTDEAKLARDPQLQELQHALQTAASKVSDLIPPAS